MDKIKWVLDNYNYITGNDVDYTGWEDGCRLNGTDGFGCGSACVDGDSCGMGFGDGSGYGEGYIQCDGDGIGEGKGEVNG